MVKFIRALTSLSLVFFVMTSSPLLAITKLTASVDRNPVMERESFVLEIVADDSVSGDELDLSPLQQTGLIVGRTATSSQTQIINGSISKTTSWNIVLVAKQAGEYTIPALGFDNVRSQPVKVTVVKSTAQTGQDNRPIFLQNQVQQTELYLQQSTKFISRLYFSPQVELQSGSLSDPTLEGAIIQQQGKDKETSEIVKGVRYRVIERVYTITPQSSGQFVIQSPTFNGEVATGNRRRSMFSSFTQSKPVSAFGDDITIDVLPIPDNYVGPWLASEIVQLNEEWQPEADEFEIGEAITRTFTLTALNVNEEQLPNVNGDYPEQFKVYPDQSESHSVLRQNALVSQRINSEAIVANEAGEFILPEVRVNWFNTKTKRQETAVLPSRTIKVVAPEGSTQVVGTTASESSQLAQQCLNQEVITPTEQPTNTSLISNWFVYLGWLGWLITSVLWVMSRKRKSTDENLKQLVTHKFDVKVLRSACQNDDPVQAREALILWGKHQFGDIENLAQLEQKVDPQLQREIRRLNLAKFSQSPTKWHGANLWTVFTNVKKRNTKRDQSAGELAPLN